MGWFSLLVISARDPNPSPVADGVNEVVRGDLFEDSFFRNSRQEPPPHPPAGDPLRPLFRALLGLEPSHPFPGFANPSGATDLLLGWQAGQSNEAR
jgi:hypothetical protein